MPEPEGGARCVSSARPDLPGGRGGILVPTGTSGHARYEPGLSEAILNQAPGARTASSVRPERRMRLSCLSPRLCTLVLGAVGIGAFDRVRKHDIDDVQIHRRSQPETACAENHGTPRAHYVRD